MKYFELYPEVPGTIQEECIVDVKARPILISSMRYEFDGWLGDELITEAGHFLVTEELGKALKSNELRGVELREAEILKSEQFEEMYPDRSIPVFKWLVVNGIPYRSDFGYSTEKMRLIVSENGLKILQQFKINNCEIEPG